MSDLSRFASAPAAPETRAKNEASASVAKVLRYGRRGQLVGRPATRLASHIAGVGERSQYEFKCTVMRRNVTYLIDRIGELSTVTARAGSSCVRSLSVGAGAAKVQASDVDFLRS